MATAALVVVALVSGAALGVLSTRLRASRRIAELSRRLTCAERLAELYGEELRRRYLVAPHVLWQMRKEAQR